MSRYQKRGSDEAWQNGLSATVFFDMANNLHISYDLKQPGQNYEAVIAKIKTLGSWARIHQSYWYVKSSLTAQQAVDAVWSVMDASDTVYVVDSTNNQAAWQNISPEVSNHIQGKWNS